MEVDYIKGQTLIIELEDECFIGEYHLINKNRTRIELINVRDFQTNELLTGIQHFYKSDVKSIKIVKDDKITNPIQDNQTITDSNITNEEFTQLSLIELQQIDNLINNSKFIQQTDRLYHDAINEMRQENEICINLESCKMGRNTRTKIITISTRNNIYIFDIISLGKVLPELKNILESDKPRKILHDGRTISDNLKFKQNVQLGKIFDTFVAHIGIGGDKNIIDLNDCIVYYFNLPEKYLCSVKNIDWIIRPFDMNRQLITAKRTALLFKLYDYLLHERMLNKFYDTCNNIFANVYRNNTDSVEIASEMSTDENNSIDKISDIDLDLIPSVDEIDLNT